MDIRELDRLLRTLRKHGVTSYPTKDGPIVLSGEAREPGEVNPRRRKAPGQDATGEIGPGDLPELEEGDGNPRTLIADLAKANDPRRKAAS